MSKKAKRVIWYSKKRWTVGEAYVHNICDYEAGLPDECVIDIMNKHIDYLPFFGRSVPTEQLMLVNKNGYDELVINPNPFDNLTINSLPPIKDDPTLEKLYEELISLTTKMNMHTTLPGIHDIDIFNKQRAYVRLKIEDCVTRIRKYVKDKKEKPERKNFFKFKPLTVKASNFNTHMDLYKDIFEAYDKPILEYNDHLVPGSIFKGVNVDGRYVELKAKSMTNGNSVIKFQFELHPSLKKEYILIIDLDVVNSRFMFTYTKSDDSMPDIESISLKLCLRNI